MIFFKIALLQIVWFIIVLLGSSLSSWALIFIAMLIVFGNFVIYRPDISLSRYLFLTILFSCFGAFHDYLLISLNIIAKDTYRFGFLSLWIIFITYYGDIFNKLRAIPNSILAIIGAFGGALSYWSAYKLGAVNVVLGKENFYMAIPFTLWAAFFPISMWLFYTDKYWDNFLDKTIFFSFDKSGFLRHKAKFTEDFNQDLQNKKFNEKKILVTGGTSGIGEEVSLSLLRLGANVLVTGRNEKKGKVITDKYSRAQFTSLDMSIWNEIKDFCQNSDVFDSVVLNAGSMPEKLIVNDLGVEFQCASQLIGHYLLIYWLKKFNKLRSGARIVWVSSGGMYLKELDLNNLIHQKNYEKVSTYANVKRAQVTLVEELAKLDDWKEQLVVSMHPGWVKTDGLKESLPQFYRLMGNRLRSTPEGADTIIWLLLTTEEIQSGGFYFDRKKVSPYLSSKYNPNKEIREQLLREVMAFRDE